MSKKFLSIILSLIILIFPIFSVTYADSLTVTNGKTVDVSFEKNADTLIESEGEDLNPSTWFAGLNVNYGQYGAIKNLHFPLTEKSYLMNIIAMLRSKAKKAEKNILYLFLKKTVLILWF